MTAKSLVERVRVAAGLLVVLTVAWSTPAGQIGEDTKNDLYVDAWGLMRRALHLWDPQVTWGTLQNQGYGYLFPMGPFYAGLGSVLPMWVVERLWWSLLLAAGYLGALALLRALAVGTSTGQHVAALSYALAPRVLTTLGGLSAEAGPELLAPLILLPLVRAAAKGSNPRRAAAWSAVAVLSCGGINATATAFAVLPSALWLLTRTGWWRRSLTWWWCGSVAAVTAWWVVPLLTLGRYSPPFLDWIENASSVSKPIGLFDVVRGTTNWLGHLVVSGGPWWPAGWAIVSDRGIIIATAALAGLGLAGLMAPLRERRFLLLLLLIGVTFMAIPHSGPLDSPLSNVAQGALDGALAPLRNFHKADPLVRIPLAVGLCHVLTLVAARRRRAVAAAAAGLVVVTAAPAMSGDLATRGTFTQMSPAWVQAGQWLDDHAGTSRALIVPAANFGEYTWGRTIDEPLRSLTTSPYAVRDGVPLAPANTIRFLDAIEQRLQSGRSLQGATAALLSTGVGFLVLRNDLDTTLTNGPPLPVIRSALQDTPDLRLVASFGTPATTIVGDRVRPVEIYAIDGAAASPVTTWLAASVPAVSGASDALPTLRDAAVAGGPVVFDGDAGPLVRNSERIDTDFYRARDRAFGGVRGRDTSATLPRGPTPTDYLPWTDPTLRTTVTYTGLTGLSASSSIATTNTFTGLLPADRPYAAVDGDPSTQWVTFGDAEPTITLRFTSPRTLEGLALTPAAGEALGSVVSAPTRIEVRADHGTTTSPLGAGVNQTVAVPPGLTSTLTIRILRTTAGAPATTETGLAEIALPGLAVHEGLVLPTPRTSGPTADIVLSRELTGFDGCVLAQDRFRCLASQTRPAEEVGPLVRSITGGSSPGPYAASGTLVADPLRPSPDLALPGIADVTASSRRSPAPAAAPAAVMDQDSATAWSPTPGDRRPSVAVTFDTPVTVATIRLRLRDDWARKAGPVVVQVSVDGRETFGDLTTDSTIVIPPQTGKVVRVTLLLDAGKQSQSATSLEVESLAIDGVHLPAPPASVGAPCGEGPTFVVGGRVVPTAVVGSRRALLGEGDVLWRACEPVTLAPGADEVVTLGTWHTLAPDLAVLRVGSGPAAGSAAAAAQSVPVRTHPGAMMTGHLSAGPERVLALTQNANPGWRATVSGQVLVRQVVDGFRQAFIVPAGMQGELVIDFAPDRAYRIGLLAGGGLAGALVLSLLVPGRRRRPEPDPAAGAAPNRHRPIVVGGVAVGFGAVVAGAVGGLLTLAVILAVPRLRGFRGHRWAEGGLAGGALVAAGAVQAGWSPGSIGSTPVEVVTRLLTLVGVVAVLAGGASSGHRDEGAFDDVVAERGQGDGDRHPEGQ